MSKQDHLISAEKLLEWIDSEEASVLWEDPYGIEKYQLVIGEIKAGTFNPDPVPTIKPGDKVRHIDNAEWGIGEVQHCYSDGSGAKCFFPDLKPGYKTNFLQLNKLEVVKDE